MSLFELGLSTGEVSLGDLLAGQAISAPAPTTTIPDLTEAICRGGWPGTLGADLPAARRFVRNYLNEIRRADLNRVSERRRDPNRALRLLRSLARNIGTPVTLKTLATDIGEGTTTRTAGEYLDDLARLFVRGPPGLLAPSAIPVPPADHSEALPHRPVPGRRGTRRKNFFGPPLPRLPV